MTKLHDEVHKLKLGAAQGLKIAEQYGQHEAVDKWKTRLLAYETVLGLVVELESTWWERLKRKFHLTRKSKSASM